MKREQPPLQPGPWLDTLRDLHAKRYSDARIADELSEIYSPLGFTARIVRYWRKGYCGLPGHANPRREYADLNDAKEQSIRGYASFVHGWGNLVAPESGEGIPLCRREAEILSALADHGPLTRPEIAERIGCRFSATLASGRKTYLANLVELRLVVVVGRRVIGHRVLPIYQLAPGVNRRTRLRRPDGVELRQRKIDCGQN